MKKVSLQPEVACRTRGGTKSLVYLCLAVALAAFVGWRYILSPWLGFPTVSDQTLVDDLGRTPQWKTAVGALISRGPRVVDRLVSAVRGQYRHKPSAQTNCLYCLARIGDKRGLPVFVEILQSSPDEDVRQAAAVHIYRFQDPSVVKELERTLNLDKGAWVREAAASSLYRLTGVRHNYKDASGNEVPFVP